MIKIKEAIIVEGKYDKIRLSAIFDTAVIETGGFRVFKDEEKKTVIREIARKKGIIVMTDSDGAGFVIRNYVKGIISDKKQLKQAYIPDIEGKEKRKAHPSKEGLLGVEGMTDEIITNAVLSCGATVEGDETRCQGGNITKTDFYDLGLTGRENSSALRSVVLKKLGFPRYMTANAMLEAINMIFTKSEFENFLNENISDKP